MVGAVLVRDGEVIAEGYHEAFGKAHAERQLLEKFDPTSSARLRGASQKMRSTDTLYINLEPCCHTNKKTPPCAQYLVERGVKNLVYGMRDPNPEVSGKGLDYLNKKGVQIFGPILEQECRRIHRGFISLMTKGRPWITLKTAVTTDGRHCKKDGSFLKITTQQQDEWSHRMLRARHDAILVGVGTILVDNPRLTIRRMENPPPLKRIILDADLRTPLSATVTGDEHARDTIIVCSDQCENADVREKIRVLEGRGVLVLRIPVEHRAFQWAPLFHALATPSSDFHGISSLLVEGGPQTWQAFREGGFVDEEITLVGTASRENV
jgi:diaminohydroxyphosphoribosylaminopyrimidine deaminase/5-amino-6-(5-phosphoribosylamino)uracil reductase